MPDWIKSTRPGLRYREHETRTTGSGRSKRPLRYYTMTYKWDAKTISEAFGWEGDYVKSEDEAYQIFLELKQNRKNRIPPFTLRERTSLKEVALEETIQQREKEKIKTLSFGDVFAKYFVFSQQNKRSVKSWKREEQLTRLHILPVFKKLPMEKIVQIQLERLKKNMADAGLTPRTIRYALAVVRQVFNFAVKHGLFEGQNPAGGNIVTRPQEDNRKQRYLTRDEAERLLRELLNHSQEVHDMALLSLYTGMRFGEVAHLRWGDVDLFGGVILLRKTKSGKNRPAFITPEVKAMFLRRNPDDHDRLVFPARSRDGQERPHQLIGNTYYNVVRRLFNEGVADRKQWVDFHTLRHTFASWLVENDTNLYLVKELLGHSDLKLTERYSHIGENLLKQAVMGLSGGKK
jgi:integrase